MPAVSKACDACRIRRKKCGGGLPCASCITSDIRCSYELRRFKRGPPGRTVELLQSILGDGRSDGSTSRWHTSTDSHKPRHPFLTLHSPETVLGVTGYLTSPGAGSSNGPITSSALSIHRPFGAYFHERSSILDRLDTTITIGIQAYLKSIIPLFPIVDAASVMERFNHKIHLTDPSFAALILAMSAMGSSLPFRDSNQSPHSDALMKEALMLRAIADIDESPSLDAVATSMILSSCLRVRKGHDAAYLRHQEAITLVELLDAGDPTTYDRFSSSEKVTVVHILGFLEAAQRSMALLAPRNSKSWLKTRFISVEGGVSKLASSLHLSSHIDICIEPMVRLWEVMDESLVECVKGTCDPSCCQLDVHRILSAHFALEAVVPNIHSMVQSVDVLITRLWLQIGLWRASVSHSLLLSDAPAKHLSIGYPLDILARAVDIATLYPISALKGNGEAMFHKLEEIIAAANNVLHLDAPPSTDNVTNVGQGVLLVSMLQKVADGLSEEMWCRYETL